MSELQATVEFSIELHKFYNVDLFQRGFYQIRTCLKVSPKLSVKIEVSLAKNQNTEHISPSFVANGYGISKIFQILYRNQEVLLDNVILFRVHLLVDSHKIEETLEKADFTLIVELWFTEQPYLMNHHNGISCVSVRTLHLHFSPIKGLHYHLPVLFDYFHLAAVTITIHAILVALHQPYINTPRSAKPLFGNSNRLNSYHQQFSLDTLFFGNTNSTKCVSTSSRLAHVRHVHQEVCSILLTTYDTLRSHLQEYMKLLPKWQQPKLETRDILKHLNNLNSTAKMLEAEDDFISVANSDIAQLCAENILLWQQFLDTFTCKDPILQHLAKSHHQLRVKRFSEAFFLVDNPRHSAAGCYDTNYQNYIAVSENVRRSRYLASLPPLPVTCIELDGDIMTMPIIFEDQYQDVTKFAKRRSDTTQKFKSDSFLNAINETVIRHSVKEDCNCGIIAVLQSRSEILSSQICSSSKNLQNCISRNSSPKVSLEVVKMEKNFKGKENIVKASLTIGASQTNEEMIRNISKVLLKYKEQENKKISIEQENNFFPPQQRHSKSLDHLKNAGVSGNQISTNSKSIIRSTSSQMPSDVTKNSKLNYLETEMSSGNSNDDVASSSSADSRDSYFKYSKKLKLNALNAPYKISEYLNINNSDFYLNQKIKHSESTMSMPITNESVRENFIENVKHLICNNSESMPNLIQSPNESPKIFDFVSNKYNYKNFIDNKNILTLHEINNSTIIEEITHKGCLVLSPKLTKHDPSFSSPLSSFSDEVTSEQSGWVSNSSRHSLESQSSSGPLSSETTAFAGKELSDFSILEFQKINNFPFQSSSNKEILIEKLENLAVKLEKLPSQLNENGHEDFRLLPPQQFRDVPSPPEHFRDPPPEIPNQKLSEKSLDNLINHICDFKNNKKLVEKKKNLKVPVENFFFDIIRENKREDQLLSKRNKRKPKEKEKIFKVTRDKDFEEFENKLIDNDTSVISISSYKNGKINISPELKNPFKGYLFKEDIESLKENFNGEESNYELEKTKFKVSRKSSLIKNSYFKNDSKINFNEETTNNTTECEDCCDKEEKSKHKNIEEETLLFVKAKEDFKKQMNFTGMIYSDFPTLASTLPYFHISDEYRIFSPEGLHLIVCVHGLDGNSNDLRLVKTYVELGLPGANLEFLMSERNQGDTFSDFETMTDKLVSEILYHIETCGPIPSKISFIGHSLGNIIIRSAITRPQLKHLLPRFHTFLSLSGPHLGTLYNNSGLVNVGMWFMQKWKKSGSLLQLSLKDASNIRQAFLYRLSQKSNLHHFKNILLCGSSQDRYVPMHSARIELCKAAIKDTTILGAVYREMVHNIMYPVINSPETTLVRYDIHHALPNTANSLIGRAAHIAVLDSELFIEKFLVVTGLKYFR